MKKIEAIVRPERLEAVKEALGKFGIHGMTVSQVMGCGTQKGRTEVYRGHEYSINLLPKVKIEIVLRDQEVEKVIEVIAAAARTGQAGDGKIFVCPAENAVRVRTGEQGDAAV
ncbi:nitrogen regulatory protein P-II family [Thermodesulfitimonas autotrophica]|uniref:Nitrogen regulatory protein P-II family n=1 Tax=Thermodesulfitimonas autotrophica TaxID=1894989 RepID=A0A3N5AXM8_9THEO|nr:P-II family nitrogen regulator [Thermodesulfitimonas autotrophica]RPF49774.1 nitrogen regulatory protein P-II family [Thermodesulfitimonas autotrophica]